MEKEWRIKPLPEAERSESLSNAINVNTFLAALLIQRGVEDFSAAKDFFRPSLENLHDPFLMKDMDKAVERLFSALRGNEKILVYGDYDVDGTTSVAMMYTFLRRYSANVAYYIPDRYTEGYGISTQGIDYAIENGFTLIISLDCGIKSADKIAYAAENGIDFIVCDHHEPDILPPALAVLDPKRSDCKYPFKELSGCGVGFKLIQAYCTRQQIPLEEIFTFLDLLTVSIAADIVPMIGENRIFCFHGMKLLNETQRPGLRALIGVAGFKKELSISNVVFGLAPRINAAGRIAHANAAVDLLLAGDETEAKKFAERLNEKNISRKDYDVQMTAEAIEMIEAQPGFNSLKSTVLFKNDWHKGVVGIVASRCIEKYYRPTIILTESNGKAAGSARTVDGFDVYSAICECADVLEQFGGHTHAAGLSLQLADVPAFRQKFEETVNKRIMPSQLVPKIDIDMEVGFEFVGQKSYNIIKQMAPFGPGNLTPVFMTRNVIAANAARIVGDNHLKLSLKENGSTKTVEAIGFGLGEYLEQVMSGKPFDVCYVITENTFNDVTTIQLNLKGIRF